MNRRMAWLGAVLGIALAAAPARALEVDEISLPRITMEGEFVSTLDYVSQTGDDERHLFRPNAEESSVFFAFEKHLYDQEHVGGVVTRLRLEDQEAQPRFFGFLGGPRWRFSFGQMGLRNQLVRFPTVREEDLLDYTHILTAAPEVDDADHLFGNNVVLDYYLRPSFWRLAAYASGRARTEPEGAGAGLIFAEEPADDRRINGGGLVLAWDVPEPFRYEHVVRRLGVIYDTQTQVRSDGEEARQDAWLLGGVLALNATPEYPWELGFQFIGTAGLDDRDAAGDPVRATEASALPREASLASVVSLSYENRQYLRTRWRAGLTLAHKDYADIDRGTQYTVAPSWFYGVSSGLDLVAQVLYTEYDEGLAAIVGHDRDVRVQVGLSMIVEAVVNDEVVDYDSILEIEQGSLFRGY